MSTDAPLLLHNRQFKYTQYFKIANRSYPQVIKDNSHITVAISSWANHGVSI